MIKHYGITSQLTNYLMITNPFANEKIKVIITYKCSLSLKSHDERHKIFLLLQAKFLTQAIAR